MAKTNGSDAAPGVQGAPEMLCSLVERIERLEEEKKSLSDDIRDVYAEAKSNGFDVKALRSLIRLRKVGEEERAQQEALIENYMLALGMLCDTPLGQAAIKRHTGQASTTSAAHVL